VKSAEAEQTTKKIAMNKARWQAKRGSAKLLSKN
jgi:hypothetical protein